MRLKGVEVDEDRLWRFMVEHPSTMPERLSGPPRLVENPSHFAPNSRLERFRDFAHGMAEADPADPDWPSFVACTEAALTYRQAIPPEYRFWRENASDAAG